METIDALVKIASAISAVIGVIAIAIEHFSSKRRIYASAMRQLQLIKIRYEIEKIIKDGNLSPALYESLTRQSEFENIAKYSVNFNSSGNGASKIFDVALLFLPLFSAFILTFFLADLLVINDCREVELPLLGWLAGQLLVNWLIYAKFTSNIQGEIPRRFANLALGIISFFVVGAASLALAIMVMPLGC